MIEPTNSIDDRTKRLLSLGNLVHEDIQNSLTRTRNNRDILNRDNLYIEKEINNKEKEIIEFHTEGEIKIEELGVRGFYDVVADRFMDNLNGNITERKVYLYDIKTCGGWSWKMKFGRNKTLNPSIHYE